MRLLSFILSISVAAGMVVPVNAAGEYGDVGQYCYQTVWEDNFDSYDSIDALLNNNYYSPDDWGNATYYASIETDKNENKWLKLNVNDNNQCSVVRDVNSSSHKIKFDVDIVPGAAENNKIVFSDSNWKNETTVFFNTDTVYLCQTNSAGQETWQKICNFSQGTQYHVEVVFDIDVHKVTACVGEDSQICDYNGSNVGKIQLAEGTWDATKKGPVLYDNLKISEEIWVTPSPAPTPHPVKTDYGNVICDDSFNYASPNELPEGYYYDWCNPENSMTKTIEDGALILTHQSGAADSMAQQWRHLTYGTLKDSISSGQVGISFKIKPNVTDGTNLFDIRNIDGSAALHTVNFFGEKLCFGEGSSAEVLNENINWGEWYSVKLSLDFDNGKILKMSILDSSGNEIGYHEGNFSLDNLACVGINSWSAGGNGSIGIDDLHIEISSPLPTATPEPHQVKTDYGTVICNDSFNYTKADELPEGYYSHWSQTANPMIRTIEQGALILTHQYGAADSQAEQWRHLTYGTLVDSISSGQVGISFRIKPNVTDGTNLFDIRNIDGSALHTVNFFNGNLYFGEGESATKLNDSIKWNEWYSVKLSLDFENSKSLEMAVLDSIGNEVGYYKGNFDLNNFACAGINSWSAAGKGSIGIDDLHIEISSPLPTATPKPTPHPVKTDYGSVICNDPFNYKSPSELPEGYYYDWCNPKNPMTKTIEDGALILTHQSGAADSMAQQWRRLTYGSLTDSISSGQIGITFKIKPNVADGTNIFEIRSTDSSVLQTANFYGGKLYFGEADKEVKLNENINWGEWYSVKLSLDFDNGKILKMSVLDSSGNEIGYHEGNFSLDNLACVGINSWSAGGNGSIGIDDIHIEIPSPLPTPTPIPNFMNVFGFRVWEVDAFNYDNADAVKEKYIVQPADASLTMTTMPPAGTENPKGNKAPEICVNPNSVDEWGKSLAYIRSDWGKSYEDPKLTTGKVGINFKIIPESGFNNLIISDINNNQNDTYGIVFNCHDGSIHIGGKVEGAGNGWGKEIAPASTFTVGEEYSVKLLYDLDAKTIKARINDKNGKGIAYGEYPYTYDLIFSSAYLSVTTLEGGEPGKMVVDDYQITSEQELKPKTVTPEPVIPTLNPRQEYTIIDDNFNSYSSIDKMEEAGYSFWYPTITKEIQDVKNDRNQSMYFNLNYDPAIHSGGSDDNDEDQNVHFIRDLNYQYYAGTTIGISYKVQPYISTCYLAVRHDNDHPEEDFWPVLFGCGSIFHDLFDKQWENKIGIYTPGNWYTVQVIIDLKDTGSSCKFVVIDDEKGKAIVEYEMPYPYSTVDSILLCMADESYTRPQNGGKMSVDDWYIGASKNVQFETSSRVVHYMGSGDLKHTRATGIVTDVYNTGDLNRGNFDNITWNILGRYIPYADNKADYDDEAAMHSFTYNVPENDGRSLDPKGTAEIYPPAMTLDSGAGARYFVLVKDFVNGEYDDALSDDKTKNQPDNEYSDSQYKEDYFNVRLSSPWTPYNDKSTKYVYVSGGVKTRRDSHSSPTEGRVE